MGKESPRGGGKVRILAANRQTRYTSAEMRETTAPKEKARPGA